MNNMDYNKVVQIIVSAGEILLNCWNEKYLISEKALFNYVTDADEIIQDYIINELEKINNDNRWSYISEELNNTHNDYSNVWIIDPIDGTTNFIHKYPHLSISIAHVINNEVIFSIIYNPFANELFTAEKGKGAYLNGQKISVSKNEKLMDSIIAIGLPYDRVKAEIIFIKANELYKRCQDIKRKGPASLDFAYVACGRVDAYYEIGLEEWDIAPGYLLVLEAGGYVSIDEYKENNDSTRMVIVSNGLIHSELKEILKMGRGE